MKSHQIVLLATSLAVLVGANAVARDAQSPSTGVAARAFTKLSADGAKGYRDIGLARLAIFDGQTDRASSLVAEAGQAFDRARTADTTFMKAEDAMHPPAGAPHAAPSANHATPIAWIPVDQSYVLDETFARDKRVASAVGTANAQLKANQADAAKRTLKLAAVGASDTITLAPLDRTVDDVHRASALIQAHDYYGASMALKDANDAVRFDTVDVVGTPRRLARTDGATGAGASAGQTKAE